LLCRGSDAKLPVVVQIAIEAENLARRYGRRWALAGVTFVVPKGAVMMIAGRNGSGKSTLLRVLSTAIRPDGGKASVGGFDVVKQRDDIRRFSALLSHYSYLYESLSARENLEILARLTGRDGIDEVLEKVGLAGRMHDNVNTFSAGMRKRLSFARVLLQRPDVVMLDEPFGQLDPPGFALVQEVVEDLKRQGATVLLATHQVERVEAFSDIHMTLEAGRILA
jgi:heme exporter protein A